MPEDFYFPTYIGLLSPEHREKIGPALWEFLWFISRTTKEFQEGEEKLGIVLGGKPIKLKEISEDLGISERTVKRNVSRLKQEGYIESKRAPYGEIYQVKKSKKFKIKRCAKNGTSENREVPHMSKRSAICGTSNKDIKDIKRKKEGGKDVNHFQENEFSPEELIKDKYLQRRAHGFDLTPEDEQSIKRLLNDDIPIDKVLDWIDETFDEFKPKHRLDRIKHFKYVEVVILDKWAKSKEPQTNIGSHQKYNDIDWENL